MCILSYVKPCTVILVKCFSSILRKLSNTVCYMQLLNIQIYNKNNYYVFLTILKLFTANIVDV